MTLHERATFFRPRSLKCEFCLKRYRIPMWCTNLQLGGALLFVFISIYFKFFFFLGEKPAIIIDALIAVAIAELIGWKLSFVAPLVKDEYTGTASKDRYY